MKKQKLKRNPTAIEAYISVILVFGTVIACLVCSIPVQAALLVAAMIAFLFALRLGYTWKEIESAIAKRLGELTPTICILWLIGLFLGTILFSGTLPLLVKYGYELLSPKHLYLSALLVCSILSVATGSSWTSAATGGIACMTVCKLMGANEAIMAGAVISGAIFGDKISPMSETTNLAPACTGNSLWSHIHAQLYTTIPAYVISIIFFAVMDTTSGGAAEIPESAVQIIDQIGTLYHLNPILLLPVIILLVLSVAKQPVVPSLLISSLSAVIVGVIFQGDVFTLKLGASAAISGFTVESIAPAGMEIHETVSYLLNRGGMTSMVSVVMMCYCGFAMTTIMTHTGLLDRAVRPLMNFATTRVRAVLTAEISVFAILAMSGVSYISSVFVGQAWRKAYIKNGCGLPALSRTLEDVGTTVACLFPWSQSGAFFAATLGVSIYGAGGYFKFTTMSYLCPIIAVILAITGIGMFKLSPEQQEEALKQMNEEDAVQNPDIDSNDSRTES